MTLNELLLEWSYRSEKGYPNLDSPSDISLLKKILIELDLPANKIISNIEEAKTTSTEDLHEIFVAIFVAGHEKLSKDEFSSAKWIKSLQNLNKLIDPTKHISAIEEYKESLTNDKIYDLYTDAEKISNKLNSSLGYPEGLKGVSRVFATGKKEKGDIYVNQDVPGFKDRVEISLKYGKGQFNSLSASELIGTFYDIPEEVLQRKGTGFLTQIYKKDNKYKNAIDKGVREYLKFVINNYEQIQPDYQNKLKEGEKEILDNFDKNLLNNIEWEEWRKIGKTTHDAFKHAFASFPLTTIKDKEYIPTKQEAINNTIQDFLNKHKTSERSQDTIVKVLQYILGSDPENSYFYVAEGGNKMIWIPSIKRLKANEYDIEENIKEEDANYKVIVNIKEKKSGLPLFKFDILLRFAGSGGQYTTDVAQKGSEFKVENENFNKVFYSQG